MSIGQFSTDRDAGVIGISRRFEINERYKVLEPSVVMGRWGTVGKEL